jgi:hypothetical protein
VDDIIVFRNGEITEHGSFQELMKADGDLAHLVGEHVQIIDHTQTDKSSKSIEKAKEIVSIAKQADADDDAEVIPDDAEPMKLVLDDQSVFYKKSPVIAYIRSGYGAIVTISIFLFFFLVHGVRIGSGK